MTPNAAARDYLETVVDDALWDATANHISHNALGGRIMKAVDTYVQAAISSHIKQEDTGSGRPRP